MKKKDYYKPSAFILFVHEWRKLRKSNLQWEECIHLAGPAWQNMTLEDRQPYINEARKLVNSSSIGNEINISKQPTDIDEEQKLRNMQQQIEKLVRNSVDRRELETQNYYFLMVNYFTKDIYTPAELAGAQFSLQDGVQNVYHTLINPGIADHGSFLETQEHANATHQLPLPPEALGNEDIEGVYADLIDFTRAEPVFTLQEQLPIVSSALKFLNGGVASHLNVYPIEYLFYILKQATCQTAMIPRPESIHTTNTQFNRDTHEFLPNISCEFHEQRGLAKHCAKSIVTRWGFAFARNMCFDLAIKMRPNRHMHGNSHCLNEAPINHKSNGQLNPCVNNQMSCENQEASNKASIKVEPIIEEDHFHPDMLDALNSLDLDNIFEEEDCLEFGSKNCTEDCNEDMRTDDSVEDGEILSDTEEDVAQAPPTSPNIAEDCIFTRRPGKRLHMNESYPNIGLDNHLKSIEKTKERRISPKRTCTRERLGSPKRQNTSNIPQKVHLTRIGSPNSIRKNRSRSRSREDRCSGSFPRKRHIGEHGPSNSNNRNISSSCGFETHEISHKRRRRYQTRLSRSPSFSPSSKSRARATPVSPSNPMRHSSSVYIKNFDHNSKWKSNEKDLSRKPYFRKNMNKTNEKNSMTTSSLSLPNNSLRKSHSQLNGNQKSISTIITETRSTNRVKRLEKALHTGPDSMSTVISQTTHQYESFRTYKCWSPPETYCEPELQDYGQHQPVLGPHDLRHRLGMAKASFCSPSDLRYRIQQRQFSLPQSQTASYSQEQFFAQGSSRPAWGSHQFPQWPNGYDNFLPNSYH